MINDHGLKQIHTIMELLEAHSDLVSIAALSTKSRISRDGSFTWGQFLAFESDPMTGGITWLNSGTGGGELDSGTGGSEGNAELDSGTGERVDKTDGALCFRLRCTSSLLPNTQA